MKTITNNIEIGNLFASEMAKQELTIYRLHKITGINETNIKKILKGEMDSGINQYIKIATALKLKIYLK